MKRIGIVILSMVLVCLLDPGKYWGQQVEVQEADEKPYLLNDQGEQHSKTRGLFSRKSLTQLRNATNIYLLVYPGPNGSIEGASAETVGKSALAKKLSFPSIYFTVSAAANLLVAQSSNRGRLQGRARTVTELKQMSMQIRVTGLDANRKPVSKLRGYNSTLGDKPAMVLSIFPSETGVRTSTQAGNVGRATDKADVVAQHLGPLGIIASKVTAVFRAFFPAKDHLSQVAYLKSHNSFGWIWRQGEQNPIEGIHRCMVLLCTRDDVKFLKVKVDIITDWRKFGAWTKSYQYLIPVQKSTF